jgi:hypothetical protein
VSPSPSIERFAERQGFLVENLGTVVTFFTPADPEDVAWPSGTALDPNTNLPYDPTVEPASGGSGATSAAITVGRAVGGEADEGEGQAVGIMPDTRGLLVVEPDDYPQVASATTCEIHGEMYKVTRRRRRGLPGAEQHLLYVEAA